MSNLTSAFTLSLELGQTAELFKLNPLATCTVFSTGEMDELATTIKVPQSSEAIANLGD
jgi:hypothetical protein